jgi:hypothetical protein
VRIPTALIFREVSVVLTEMSFLFIKSISGCKSVDQVLQSFWELIFGYKPCTFVTSLTEQLQLKRCTRLILAKLLFFDSRIHGRRYTCIPSREMLGPVTICTQIKHDNLNGKLLLIFVKCA